MKRTGGIVDCPVCGEVEHLTIREDQAHCPCQRVYSDDDVGYRSDCACDCHRPFGHVGLR